MTMLPDPRDEQFAGRVAKIVAGMVMAVHDRDNGRLLHEMNRLLAAVVEHEKTLHERPGDVALVRAIERL